MMEEETETPIQSSTYKPFIKLSAGRPTTTGIRKYGWDIKIESIENPTSKEIELLEKLNKEMKKKFGTGKEMQ